MRRYPPLRRGIFLALCFVVVRAVAETRHYLRRPPEPMPPPAQQPQQEQQQQHKPTNATAIESAQPSAPASSPSPPPPQEQQHEPINGTVTEPDQPSAKQQTTVSAYVTSPSYRRPPFEGGGGT